MSAARVLVGVTADFLPAPRGRTKYTAYDTYVRAVRGAGARAVILPPDPDGLDDLLSVVHGIVMPGGADLDPALWGGEPGAGYSPSDPRRTEQDVGVARACVSRGVPLLAICLGMQTLNVACGGSLRTDLPDEPVRHRRLPERPDDPLPRHDVRVEGGTLLSRALGLPAGGTVQVNSSHRWAVDRAGEGLRVAALAGDGVVEALERPGLPFCLGVQWHPEHGEEAATDTTRRLLAAFVAACAEEGRRRR